MKRREFLAVLAGMASTPAWMVGAHAQQPKMCRIGVLLLDIPEADAFRTALRAGLHNFGYVEGQNISFEFRSAESNLDVLFKLAAELFALNVDVIVALYTPCARAAQQATRKVPIVTVAGDLVGTGLVKSLNRPDGNITGVSMIAAELHAKCVELFRDMFPYIRRVAALGNTTDPFSKPFLEQVLRAGKTTGVEIAPVIMVRELDEINAAFAAMKKEGAEAVVVQGSLASKTTADLALKNKLPAATFTRLFAEAGGLMSYGADTPDLFRSAASYVGRILQGTKPADMPIEQPTKFELVINLKTAKALGLTIAESFLFRADKVIE